MQRSITHKNSVAPFIYVALYLVYSALSGVYIFLPPLLSVLFLFFTRALKHEDSLTLFLVSLCLVIFEAQNNFILFSTIIYFLLIYRYVLPKIYTNFSCIACIRISTVLLAYLGFFIFNSLLSYIFLLPEPSINYYIIYYIVIEFFIVSIL